VGMVDDGRRRREGLTKARPTEATGQGASMHRRWATSTALRSERRWSGGQRRLMNKVGAGKVGWTNRRAFLSNLSPLFCSVACS